MPYPTFARAALGAVFVLLLQLAPVQAQPFQYVATTGSDAGACGAVTAPCRTFQRVHDLVGPGFAIVALDSGDFNAVTITKSIAILARGVAATGWSGANTKITINAGASDVIYLDGLNLGRDAPVAENSGIELNSGGRLHVRNCTIRNFGTAGIYIAPGGSKRVFVSDCTIADNWHGIWARGNTEVFLDRVAIEGNLRDGVRSHGSGVRVRISNSTINDNRTGLNSVNGGKLLSFGNNAIHGNQTNGAPTATVALK